MRGTELKTVVTRVEQQMDAIVVELKAVADNLASVMQTGYLMNEWLTRARGGDPEALRWVLVGQSLAQLSPGDCQPASSDDGGPRPHRAREDCARVQTRAASVETCRDRVDSGLLS